MFGFLCFENNGLRNINSILKDKKLDTGEEEFCLLTSVHHWLNEVKQINNVISEPLVPEWGLGFRLSALEKMGLTFQWNTYNNNDNLTFVKIPPHSTIDFSQLNSKRDVVVLCPSLKERKKYFEVEKRSKSKRRSFPIWHWMSISKGDIINFNRDDENIDRYLNSHFSEVRNYRGEDTILQEEELF